MTYRLMLSALFLIATQQAAGAAVTKSTTFACKGEADLKMAALLRAKKDSKASAVFMAGKVGARECIEAPKGASVGIDLRNPPLFCIRAVGDLDCYWTPASAIDEFPSQAGQSGRPSAPGGGRRRR